MKFEFLDHTADAGLKIYGRDLSKLFHNAALGMYSIILGENYQSREEISHEVELSRRDRELLLVGFLQELHYLFETEGFVYSETEFEILEPRHLKARVFGEQLNESQHSVQTEIKAVTLHLLEIEKRKGILEGKVLFDI